MTSRLKKLLIECHPDRHGGDHSRMEEYFRAAKRPAHGTFRCVDCATTVSRQGTRCGVCFQAKRRSKKALPTVVATFLALCLCVAVAGLGATIRPVQSPKAASQDSGARVQVSGIKQSSLPAVPVAAASAAQSAAAAAVKPFVLTWDAEPGITNWTVYSGTARNQWTATNTITTNVLEITDRTKAYGITALFLGAPSVVAYWPSNRLGQLWLTGYSADLTQRTNLARLTGTFTNNPPGNMQLWGVENRTVGWE
jgi:hypothetical protein